MTEEAQLSLVSERSRQTLEQSMYGAYPLSHPRTSQLKQTAPPRLHQSSQQAHCASQVAGLLPPAPRGWFRADGEVLGVDVA